MTGLPTVPAAAHTCPFCGVATAVPHETQEGCIAALHSEIGRMREILATTRPAGVSPLADNPDDRRPAIRLTFD